MYPELEFNESMITRLGVSAIINLQEVNEHPSCGDGIGKCGFSYDPVVDVMDKGGM